MNNNIGISNFLIQSFLSNGENSISNLENINSTDIFGELLEKFNLPNILSVTEPPKFTEETSFLNIIEASSKQISDLIDYSDTFQSNVSSQTLPFEIPFIQSIPSIQNISLETILDQTMSLEGASSHNISSEDILVQNISPQTITPQNASPKVMIAQIISPEDTPSYNMSSEIILSQNVLSKDELSQNIASDDNIFITTEKRLDLNDSISQETLKAVINNEEVFVEIEPIEESHFEEEINESSVFDTDTNLAHFSIQDHLDNSSNSNSNNNKDSQEDYVQELKTDEKKYVSNNNFVLNEKEHDKDNASLAQNNNDESDESKINEIFYEDNHFKKIEINPQKVALNYKKFEHMHDTKSIIEQLKVNLNKLTPESNKITVKLTPEELGSIEVIVDFDNKSIKGIEMTIEKVDTYNLLRKDTNNLKVALHGLGLEFNESTLNLNLEHNNSGNNQNSGKTLSQERLQETIDITDKVVTNYLPKDILGKVDILA